jgi:hypothetical protein
MNDRVSDVAILPGIAETFTKCPYCDEPVDPDAPEAVYAVEQVDLPGMGQVHDFVDGRASFFHAECPPEPIGYARRPRPN